MAVTSQHSSRPPRRLRPCAGAPAQGHSQEGGGGTMLPVPPPSAQGRKAPCMAPLTRPKAPWTPSRDPYGAPVYHKTAPAPWMAHSTILSGHRRRLSHTLGALGGPVLHISETAPSVGLAPSMALASSVALPPSAAPAPSESWRPNRPRCPQ